MKRNIITGIDVGTSSIKIIVAEKKAGQNLNILAAIQNKSYGLRKGHIINFDETAESIRTAVKNAEKISAVPIKQAYIAVGGISLGSIKSKGTVMIARASGEVTDTDIKRVINQCESYLPNLNNRQIIDEIPLAFKIDNELVLGNPIGMKGSKLEAEVFYITCLSQYLSELIKIIESSGITIREKDIIASPLAVSSVALTKHEKEVGCVLANIGAGTISIVVFEEGVPISLEVFSIGSMHITNDIALGLQIPIEEAEKLKIEFDSDTTANKRKLTDIIEARLNDMFELIESHLKKIGRNNLLPAGIILTGGGSGLINIQEIAKSSLQLPAKVITRVSIQTEDQGINITGSYKEQVLNNPSWSVALGLCVIGFKDNDKEKPSVNINIFGNLKSKIKKILQLFLP